MADMHTRVGAAPWITGVLLPLLRQLHSAHTPPDVKESAVKTLDSLIQSGKENAAAICNAEVREWVCLIPMPSKLQE